MIIAKYYLVLFNLIKYIINMCFLKINLLFTNLV